MRVAGLVAMFFVAVFWISLGSHLCDCLHSRHARRELLGERRWVHVLGASVLSIAVATASYMVVTF